MSHRKTPTAVKAVYSLGIRLGLSVLLGLCLGRGIASTAFGGTAKDSLEVRVMSFNIRYGSADDGQNRWEKRRGMVFNVLRENRPDVVGLQEALLFQLDGICEALGEYRYLGAGRDDGRTKGEYSAILYRQERFEVDESGTFWLSDTPELPGSITWGNACTRICTWGRFVEKESGRAFYLFNTHLDHVSQPSREKSAKLLVDRIGARKHADPFVLTGDFNVGEKNPVVLYLKGEGRLGEAGPANPIAMIDTFRAVHPDATEVGTFHAFKGTRTGDKIDYVLVQPGTRVLDAQILGASFEGRYPSDHFAVVATVALRSATAARTLRKLDE